MKQRENGGYYFSPTDLVNFLGCSHSTVLDLRAFHQDLLRDEISESGALLARKGDEHEKDYLQILKNEGKSVAEIPKDLPLVDRCSLTLDAMRNGVEVVYQAALYGEQWGGFADFLEKTDGPSALGPYRYEATDTKLARSPQIKHLIQLGVYSGLVGTIQGVQPEKCHIVLGDRTRASFLVNDSAAYIRHAMQRLVDFASSPPTASYPEPCSHCSNCHWQESCTAQWQEDDHLSLVANIQRIQVAKLERAGVKKVAQLGALPVDAHIPEMNPKVFDRLRAQAALQDHKRRTGENKLEVLDLEPDRGFARLPKPDPGDLFFDMEGDPLYPDGLEYLFGVCFLVEEKLEFKTFWAHDHEAEKETFRQFMDFLSRQLTDHPEAYIYHYSHYETTALKRLAGRYAVAEHQLDDLLRRKKFVDLYKVVRESIRISEPSYSIKNLETFYMEKRQGEVATADDSIVVYNRWRETGEAELLQQIAQYNEVDCISTAKLQEWLLKLRPRDLPWFDGTSEPTATEKDVDKTSARLEREARFADYQQRLLESATGGKDDFRRKLADLLEFHSRENRPQWWEYFDRRTRSEEELLHDTECIADMTLVGPPQNEKRSLLYTYQFPPQETKRLVGDAVIEVSSLSSAGSIAEIEEENLIVRIKRASSNGLLPEKLTVGPGGPVNSDALREAVYRFAADVLAGNNNYRAVRDILSKVLPRLQGREAGQPLAIGEDLLNATTEAVAALDGSYLFIQGPPGAGKTHTSAHVIVELIRRDKKIGVAANSHKVIHNLLDKIEELADKAEVYFRGRKKSSSGNDESVYNGKYIKSEESAEKISMQAKLLAGSAWLFAHERFNQHLDYLFIDEAGQVSVANVIAMGTAARNIVLVGDQMQLGQPIQGVHPGESGLSILDYLLGDQATVTPDRGIFLNQTRRLHPTVCKFISEAFYEGRLEPHPENAGRRLVFDPPLNGITPEGIHFLPVYHVGCSQKSEDEGKVIREYFHKLLGQKFVDKDGSWRAMTEKDILVVSPYNVQVNHLKSILPNGARVGTVDKFQGQEAPVVLLSMATSDAECLPRNIEFLFSPNRLNVALSRAQCLALVVACPRLLETPCKSVDQLRLLNKFCQLIEFARYSGA